MKRNTYGLALRGETLSALKLKPAGKSELARVEWYTDFGPDERQHAELVKAAKRTLLVLPAVAANLIQVRLPALKQREVTAAIHGLVTKQKGPSASGWKVDHFQRGTPGGSAGSGERQTYTALYCEKKALDPVVERVAGSGLYPNTVLSSPLVLEALLRDEIAALPKEERKSWSMVYLGRDELFLVIGDMLGPLIIRELPSDLSDGEDRDEYVARLATEVERSHFFARQSEQSFAVESVHVAGNPDLAVPLVAKLDESGSLPTRRWEPEAQFECDGSFKKWAILPLLAAAAIDPRGLPLNLFVNTKSEETGRALRSYAIAAAGTLLAISAPVILGGSLSARGVQETVMRVQSDQLGLARKQARMAAKRYLLEQSLILREQSIAANGDKDTPLAEVLRDIASRLPDRVRLTDLNLSRERESHYRLHISGEAIGKNAEEAQALYMRFRESLAQSPLIVGEEEPSFIQINAMDGKNEYSSRVTFSIEYSIRKEMRG